VIQNLGISFLTYNFVVPIDAAQSISKFWFEVDEKDGSKVTPYTNGGSDYVIDQDQVFFVPMLSTVDTISNSSYTKVYTNRDGSGSYKSYNLVAAVRSELSPSRVYIDGSDSAVPNYPYAISGSADFTLNSTTPAIAGYKFYIGTFPSSGLQLTIDVHAVVNGTTSTQQFMSTSTLDNTPYIAPGTVSTGVKPTAGAFSWKNRSGRAFSLLFSIAIAMAFSQ